MGWKSKQCEQEVDVGQGLCKQHNREGSTWKGQGKGLKSEKLTSRRKRSVTGNQRGNTGHTDEDEGSAVTGKGTRGSAEL